MAAEKNDTERKPPKISWLEQWGVEDRLARNGIRAGITFAVILFIAIMTRAMFFTFVDNYQMPYMFDSRTGQTTVLKHTGYIPQMPIVQSVHHIDLRPMQVCISAIQRVLNCKLVQFNTTGIETFIAWHGRGNYDIGAGQFNEILKNYAYDGSGKDYPFLTVLRELKNDEKPADEKGKPK